MKLGPTFHLFNPHRIRLIEAFRLLATLHRERGVLVIRRELAVANVPQTQLKRLLGRSKSRVI